MTVNPPKVLIVESDERLRGIWTRRLKREGVEVLETSSLEEGERLFEANSDLSFVIMDSYWSREELNSLPLVQRMLQTFQGPIVAGSGNPDVCKILKEL